jgi:hypothetical protein
MGSNLTVGRYALNISNNIQFRLELNYNYKKDKLISEEGYKFVLKIPLGYYKNN